MTKDAESSDGRHIHIIILTTINEKDEKINKKNEPRVIHLYFERVFI